MYQRTNTAVITGHFEVLKNLGICLTNSNYLTPLVYVHAWGKNSNFVFTGKCSCNRECNIETSIIKCKG